VVIRGHHRQVIIGHQWSSVAYVGAKLEAPVEPPAAPTILCGTHRQFATDETRASVVAFSFLVRLVDRLTQRFLLCHFRRGTRSRTLPLARCAIAALQHRALTSLWPSSSQPVVLEGPVGRSIQQHRHGRANHPVSRTTPWQGREAGNAGASPHTFLAALLPKGHLPRS